MTSTVPETIGDPVTGGPPMLMSKAVYLVIIYKFLNRWTSSDWNSSPLQGCNIPIRPTHYNVMNNNILRTVPWPVIRNDPKFFSDGLIHEFIHWIIIDISRSHLIICKLSMTSK